MREQFFSQLHELMSTDERIIFITGDLGYFFADRIRNDFPDRFFNVGAAEQAMMGIGIGMALQGKVPFVYSITPFLLFRPFEAIRNYLDYEQIPVILVGSGRDKDYLADGPSHWADDDLIYLPEGIVSYREYDSLKQIVDRKEPSYINLRR